MTSSYLTFELSCDLIIQCVQILNTGYAHVKISGLYIEINRNYTLLNDGG